MTTPRTRGFHHVGLVTADAGRALGFYRDALGLVPLRSEGRRLSLGDAAGSPGSIVDLVEDAREGIRRGRPGIGGVHHTAFGVETEEALLKWKRRLVDLGSQVSGPYDRGYFTSVYFRDPDGQILEIATAGPGYAIDEPADALGGELVLPPQRIVRGHRDEAAIAALSHPEPVPEISPDMELAGIHHVSGITDDLERAGAFLEEALGLRLVKRTTNRDDPSQLHFFWAGREGGEILPHSAYTLFGWPAGWNRARTGPGQTDHLAFRAGPEESLGAWSDHLRALGIEVSDPIERDGARSLYLLAPDGQRVKLVADAPAAADGAASDPAAGTADAPFAG